MLKLLPFLLLLPGCATLGIPTPWATRAEVEQGDATTLAEADRLAAARVEASTKGEAPAPILEAPDPVPAQGTDWGALIAYAITALTGTGGALAYRALDHRRKAKRKPDRQQPA